MDKTEILKQIEQQLDHMTEFCQLQLIVKTHRGKFTRLETMRSTPHTYRGDDIPNATAATEIWQMLKAAETARDTGALSFTLVFKDGNAASMSVQDFRKI